MSGLTPTQAAAALGVDPGASKEQVKEAYRRLALKFHPDRDPTGATKFQHIQEAYQVLLKPGLHSPSGRGYRPRSGGGGGVKRTFRPGHSATLAMCGASVLAGCALFGTALYLHLEADMYNNHNGVAASTTGTGRMSRTEVLSRIIQQNRSAREQAREAASEQVMK